MQRFEEKQAKYDMMYYLHRKADRQTASLI